SRDDAWLSEGFATYYQAVLRARAGFFSARYAWQKMHEGFERGRRQTSSRSLAETSARMGREYQYMRVYWSGAAIALLADVALRKSSGGKKALDDALRALRTCCLHDAHLYSAPRPSTAPFSAFTSKALPSSFSASWRSRQSSSWPVL